MREKYCLFFVVSGLVLFLDQVTKIYISSVMSLHESFPVINGLFNITYVKNPGAAFGFLANAVPLFRSIFFVIVTLIAIALILYFMHKSKIEETLLTISLSFILGGAIGNLVDRARLGEVVDFLDFHIASYHWPAFNVADMAISTGAVILIYNMIKRRKEVSSPE